MAETLLHILKDRATAEPDREALRFEGESLTYGELWSRIGDTAAALRRHGLELGGRVVMALPNGLPFFPVFYGVQAAGGVAVPVFPDSGVDRMIDIAGLCGAKLVVVPSLNGMVEAPPADTRTEAFAGRILAVEDLGGAGPATAPRLPSPEEPAFLQYTSGSTGNPKGVRITHGMLITNCEQMIGGMGITPRDRFVSWLPVSHDMGLILMTMVPFHLGLPLLLLPTSAGGIRRWMQAIEGFGGTFTAGPDFSYRLAMRTVGSGARPDVTSLRMALNAAEPVRARTITEFEETFGLGPTMAPAYGLAEATVGVSTWPPRTPFKQDASGIVSVGRPFAGIDIVILRDGEPADRGEDGEIAFRSPAASPGYFNNPAATAELRWRDDFVRTGDIGVVDSDGDLFILGREKNIIIQAGRTIAPQEVEETVDCLPFVRRSAAVGIDRGRAEGEQIYVFAEVRRADAPAEKHAAMVISIVRAVKDRLGRRPGRAYLVAPRTIPMTHNGKVRHAHLKDLHLSGDLKRGGRLIYPDY